MTSHRYSVQFFLKLGCLLTIVFFLFACEDNSPTGPDPTGTPQTTSPPASTATPVATPTPKPSSTAAASPTSIPTNTPVPPKTPTRTPSPTSTPQTAASYHGDTYWGQFEQKVGVIQFTVSPQGTVEGTAGMYAYCMNPVSEKYFTVNFKTTLKTEGGFEFEYFSGDIHLGWLRYEIKCANLAESVEGSWSYFDNSWPPHGEWHGWGQWRAFRQ